jgi:uridine kinase
MHTKALKEALAEALRLIGETQPRCGETKVVAVDGPSGSGKTFFTTALAAHIPSALVLHMDDMYPGWDGLSQGVATLHDRVLSQIAQGEQATYQGWDWEHETYAEWRGLPATRLLLVDGVGSGAGRNAGLESVLIWLEADREVRFRRGIERDGESYLPQWQRWAAQEEALFRADRTRSRADLIINTTP